MIISILGCGWLGFPLARHLKKKNTVVNGSTTTSKKMSLLKQSGIHPYQIQLPDSLNDSDSADFWKADVLFLNIPPDRNSSDVEKSYPELIRKMVKKIETHKPWIIFASSTSVYSNTGGLTTEEDAGKTRPSRESGKALLKSENILQDSVLDTTILRFGGLYGHDRHPVRFLSGKKNLDGASKPVNLVHQADCIQIILEVLKKEKKNEIYNVVSDGHPPRKEFYQSAARHFNLPLPSFKKSEGEGYRVISNKKVKSELDYSFIYPNPMDHTP